MIKQYARSSHKGSVITDDYGTRYVQETNGPRIGVMVAIAKDKIGWSLISEKEDFGGTLKETKTIQTPKGMKTVTFDIPVWNASRVWEFGTRLAMERAEEILPTPKIIPRIMQKELALFAKRCNAYFK